MTLSRFRFSGDLWIETLYDHDDDLIADPFRLDYRPDGPWLPFFDLRPDETFLLPSPEELALAIAMHEFPDSPDLWGDYEVCMVTPVYGVTGADPDRFTWAERRGLPLPWPLAKITVAEAQRLFGCALPPREQLDRWTVLRGDQ